MKLMDILEQMRNISSVIKQLLQTSYDDMTPENINNGYCVDFADAVYNHMGATSDIYFMSDEEFWDSDFAKPGDEWSEVNGEGYNLSALSRFGSRISKSELDGLQMPSHTWIYYKGKHYDAETPNGVLSIWDMPIFKRASKK